VPSIPIGPLNDLPEGRAVPIDVAGRRLAVVRVGDDVFAIEDRCSHRGFPLSEGAVRDATLICRTHGACFDLRTGAVLRGPARRAVRTYPVTVVDGHVSVDVSA
jgi:3-phenylpropionate/trans-cinnamate dioxygenase ferredoxin subunit